MKLTRKQIDAFFRGDPVSDEIRQQIRSDLDDPTSQVAQRARRSAELTRMAFDPDSPLFADLGAPLASRFSQLRAQQHLTVEAIAERAQRAGHNLDVALLQAIESGQQPLGPILATKLAPALGVSVNELLRQDEKPIPVQLLGGSLPATHSAEISSNLSMAQRSDLLRDLSDYLPHEVAVAMLDAWSNSPEALREYLDSYATSCTDFAATIARAVAAMCLRKDHAQADELVEKLFDFAAADSHALLMATYLRGRQAWYTDKLDVAAEFLENARQLAITLSDEARQAQSLLYLGRIATVSPTSVSQSAVAFIEQARALAQQVRRDDIELLALRAEMIRLRVAKERGKVIGLARELLDPTSKWVNSGNDFILDSVRVDLALSLRYQFTEPARREAEELYRHGIARHRDDSHTGMCHYLISDLYVDRMLECLRAIAQQRENHDRIEALLVDAQRHHTVARELCEQAKDLLQRRADVAALRKVNRRLTFLQEDGFTVPNSVADALADYAVTRQQVTEKFLGLNLAATQQPFAPADPVLTHKDLEQLLDAYFSGVMVPLESMRGPNRAELQLDHFLTDDSALCIPWPVGDSLVVRIMSLGFREEFAKNLGWFTIDGYVTDLRPALSGMLELDADTFLAMHQAYLLAVQERLETIDPFTHSDLSDMREIQHTAILAPTTNADWLCPVEWLLTGPNAQERGVSLLDVTKKSVSYVTSSRPALPSLDTCVAAADFEVLVTPQVLLNGESLQEAVSRRLRGHSVRSLGSIDNTLSQVPIATMLVAHADEAYDLQSLLERFDLKKTKALVLLFCSSTHYRWSQGPFVDGLALRIRERLPSDAVLVGSRVPVSLEEAARFAEALLATDEQAAPIAERVTSYLQRARRYGGANPYTVPWVVMT